MRERYLLRADRSGYGYKEIVEFTPGAARLLIPDGGRRTGWWLLLGSAILVEFFGIAWVLGVYAPSVRDTFEGVLGGMWGSFLYFVLPWILPVVTVMLADHYLPAYLARHPLSAIPFEVVSSESYGFFQEVHALSGGRPLRITVNGRRKGFERALRVVRSTSPPAA